MKVWLDSNRAWPRRLYGQAENIAFHRASLTIL